MRKFKLYIIFFLLFVFACNDKDCACSQELVGKWEVIEFMSVESVLYAKDNNNNPSIEFLRDGTTNIKLDINACFGSYETGENSNIDIADLGCPEACCDSDFSLKFMGILPQVTTYEIENERLKLNVPGWGWIELQTISE